MHLDSLDSLEILDWALLSKQFSSRDRHAHKGDFGHVLMIGGDYGMGGAIRLSAQAALRVGAGVVTVATRQEHIALVCASYPEIICHGIHDASDLSPILKKATVIVIGPGLGQSDWSKNLMQAALQASKPMVIDADALNLLSKSPQKKDHWILTPHVGEAARLLHCTPLEIQADRFSASKKLLDSYGGVVVLKGCESIVAIENEYPSVCKAGNPGMATSGMGDVLSGVIAGLLAQHFSLLSAAKTGVLLHAMAGDKAAQKGERGMIASDLMTPLRQLVNGRYRLEVIL